MIRVVILEDHPMAMDGYLGRLAEAQDIAVVATVNYGEALAPTLVDNPADVLLMDIQVPTDLDNPNPFPIWHAIADIHVKFPSLEILIISMYDRPALIDAALEVGVSGYILKDDFAAYNDLAAIVRSVTAGGAYFSPLARQRWLHRRGDADEPLLSPRQLESLSLCASYPDASIADLAQHMSIAQSTLRNLLSRTYLKLGVNSRLAAVARARQLDLLLPDIAEPRQM